MTPAVERAIAETRAAYPETALTAREDGEGGAYVIVEELDPGPPYRERATWVRVSPLFDGVAVAHADGMRGA
jgi:hypothetical protein